MNFLKLSMLVVLTAAVALGGAGCKRKPKPATVIPGNTPGGGSALAGGNQQPPRLNDGSALRNTQPTEYTTPIKSEIGADANGNTPLGTGDISSMKRVPEFFQANTVYFDYDRAAVRAAERVRVEEVAAYLKGKPTHMVQIEGHCDERGTEEYNRALGERRALAVREYLINLGVQAERVHTISFGEDKPAEIGNSESAWAKNRRGVFILLTP